MSLLPLIFSNWWENLDEPHRLVDQNFGLAISPESLLSLSPSISLFTPRQPSLKCPMTSYYRPWNEILRKEEGGSSTVRADKDKFNVVLDVQQFEPDEISVKVVDRFIVVEGKHEEKQDQHGWVSRQFTRRYMIPEQCDIEQVTSKLSSDGVLSISAPRKEKLSQEGERVINVERTGKPAVRDTQKEAKKTEAKADEAS